MLVVGAGRTGKRHTEAQKALGSNVKLFDTNTERTAQLAQALGVTSDLVYVCTPLAQHLGPITLAIEAGKPVFSEKPLTGNLKEALIVQELVHLHNTPLIVGNYYTLDGPIIGALNQVRHGRIGRMIDLEASYLHDMGDLFAETPWRNEDNFLYDGGVHPVHLALRIAGEPVHSVFASTSNGKRINQDYQLDLKFESGLTAQIRVNSREQVPHGAYLQISGTEGTLKAYNLERNSFFRISRGSERFEEVPVRVRRLPIDLTAEIINRYLHGTLKSFNPLPGIDESVECIRILDAAERSIASRIPVYL